MLSASFCQTIVPQTAPNVNIKKSVSKSKFKIGETGTYTLVVTSDSLETVAKGVKVNDTVPGGLVPVSNSWKVVDKNGQATSDSKCSCWLAHMH